MIKVEFNSNYKNILIDKYKDVGNHYPGLKILQDNFSIFLIHIGWRYRLNVERTNNLEELINFFKILVCKNY